MVKKVFCLFTIFAICINSSSAQNKAAVIYNVWNNDLDNYNPKIFYDNLFTVFQNKLSVKEFTSNSSNPDIAKLTTGWDKNIQNKLTTKKGNADSIYYIALSCQLKLPVVNLGKFLFKNPPRSSKMTFTYHIYNGAGAEVAGDTIINRGCLIKTTNEEKGSKFFYSDYESFKSDLQCHLEVIKKQLQDKQLRVNQKQYAML